LLIVKVNHIATACGCDVRLWGHSLSGTSEYITEDDLMNWKVIR
jgi:hypothetical protein